MNIRYHDKSTDMGIAASALMAGLALGAAAAFVFDPRGGRARRAFAGQKMRRAARLTGGAVRGARIDLANRTRGAFAEARSALHARNESVDDSQLAARVRSRIGHAITHPGAVDVVAVDGCVLLTGDILASEMDALIDTVKSVPGVIAIEQNLNRFTDPSHVPSLQGGRAFGRNRGGAMRTAPRALSSLMTLAAAGAAVYGAARMMDVNMTALSGRLLDAVRPPAEEESLGDFDDLDAAERAGQPPDWIEVRGSLTSDRFF